MRAFMPNTVIDDVASMMKPIIRVAHRNPIVGERRMNTMGKMMEPFANT